MADLKYLLLASLWLVACGGSASAGDSSGSAGSAGTKDSAGAGAGDRAGSGGTANGSGGTANGSGGTANGSGGTAGAAVNSAAGNTSSAGASAQACIAVPGCGGDVVGTWKISSYCSDVLMSPNASKVCDGAVDSISKFEVSGGITFRADGTTLSDFTMSFSEHSSFPPTCFSQPQCEQLAATLMSEPGVSNVVFNYDANAGCDYSLDFMTSVTGQTGTYQLSGNTITQKNDSATKTPASDDYCVSGNTLTVSSKNANGQTTVMTLKR